MVEGTGVDYDAFFLLDLRTGLANFFSCQRNVYKLSDALYKSFLDNFFLDFNGRPVLMTF